MIRYKSSKTDKNQKAKIEETADENVNEVVEREENKPVDTTTGNASSKSSQAQEPVSPEGSASTDRAAQMADEVSATTDNSAAGASQSELQLKVDDLNDRYLRLYSEFDNYRKRTLKERIELSKTASEEVIRAMLPVMDDFDRALKAWETAEVDDAHLEGMKLISNKLQNILTQKGLEEIPAMGLPFNTDFHEAITQIPSPTPDLKDKIVDVVEKGYTLQGKVIRFAKVVVGS